MQSSYVCHLLRLNRVPEIIIDGYYAKLVTLTHLFSLSRVKDTEKMTELYEKVLSENMTVLQTDYLVRETLHHVTTEGERITKDEIEEIIKNLSVMEGLSVKVIQTRIKATLKIEIKGNLEKTSRALRQVLERLKS